MAPRYRVQIYNRAGVEQARLNDSEFLSYTKEVNAPGLLQFVVPGNHDALQYLELDGQVEVWRSDPVHSIDWAVDFYGLYRFRKDEANDGRKVATIYCPGQMHYLQRAIVAYAANTADRSIFTSDPAETIMKTLVTYNATNSGSTADGRDRNTDDWADNISVAADSAGGNTLDESCARRNLLTTLQGLADAGGLDFELVKTAAESWEFRTSTLLGSDLTNSIVFSLAYGNMDAVRIERNALAEPTIAVVGGQGTDDSRTIEVRTGANYNSRYNSHEVFVNALQYTTSAGLQKFGDARLAELEARDKFDFETLDTQNVRYQRDWNLGDKVTARYETLEQEKQIAGVTVTVRPGSDENEIIRPRLDTP